MPLSDTVIGARLRVEAHADLQLGVVLEERLVGERLEAQLVAGVRRVRDQLAQEDLLVAVQGVDHQVEQLLDLGLEAQGLFRGGVVHRSPRLIPNLTKLGAGAVTSIPVVRGRWICARIQKIDSNQSGCVKIGNHHCHTDTRGHPAMKTFQWMRTTLLGTCCLFFAAALPGAAWAQQQVVIVTSFPKELTEAYKKAFESQQPGRQGRDPEQAARSPGVAYVREAPATNKPDIFWVSAPDAFEVLSNGKAARQDRGARQGGAGEDRQLPDQRSQGLLLGQALAGYGLMWNTRYMKANKLPEPEGMGGPGEAGLFRPRRDVLAVALRHDAPHGRDHPAGRRLGQGLAADADDRGQLRRHHRAQLRRARRRQQRPVRHRPGDRFLRPRRRWPRASRSNSSILRSPPSCPPTSA